MSTFMGRDFLLDTETAKTLYHNYAAAMPILDYHSHLDVREIAGDARFANITRLWLAGDHYKWRLMRWCGVDEARITGSAPDEEKFAAFAAALPRAIGNPVYHWTHLELRRYFDCELVLGPQTAGEVWRRCNAKLSRGFSARQIVGASNIKALCTTDDPADDLSLHTGLREDGGFAVKVLPSFRPDNALNVHKPGFAQYISRLGGVWGGPITSFSALCRALGARLEFFAACGCLAADHGLDELPWNPAAPEPESVFRRAAGGELVPFAQAEGYQAALLRCLAQEYRRLGVAMQLHYGVRRDVSPPALAAAGAGTGHDSIAEPTGARKLCLLLGAMESDGGLPKTVLYSLNPADNEMLASLAGAFQGGGAAGRVQHGAAWWFNDSKRGMEAQISALADVGVLGSFIGMLTDSRSLTGYVRHEYFRRVLCGLIGRWVENGEYPADIEALGGLVEDISFKNAARFFGLKA